MAETVPHVMSDICPIGNGEHDPERLSGCSGTWNHSEQGGRKYNHDYSRCRKCGEQGCVFTHATVATSQHFVTHRV